MYAFDSYARYIKLTRGVAEISNMATRERMVARRGRRRGGSTSSGAAFVAGCSRRTCVFVDHPEKNRQKRPSRECDTTDRRRRRRPLPLVSIGALASAAVVLLLSRTAVEGQYTADTLLFEENMEKAEADLTASLKGGDYVEDVFFPERQYADTDIFVYEYPDSSDYTIGIIVDPCKGNSYDCCDRFYGAPEYPMLIDPDQSSYRVVDKYLFADTTEILANTVIVDKEGVTVPTANSRFADDEIVIEDNCTAAGVPDGLSCVGFRQKQQRSTSVARCTDNNQTVDAGSSCQNVAGEVSEHCLAVGYSQTAISVICGGDFAEDDHCGTFLELHVGYANYYADTEGVLSEVRLLTANVTGYTTTTIPTTWMNDSSKILCAFEHASLLEGTMVLIAEEAPVCCCPRTFSQKDQLGSLFCPVHNSLEGPFAATLTSIADLLTFEEESQTYPFCPSLDENEDLMVVSEYSTSWERFFTREAASVGWDNATATYTSDDLEGNYDGVCEYLPQCALSAVGTCNGDDREYTFKGQVGKITLVPDDPEDEQYEVTFNNGRTSYGFNQEHLQVEQDYNYEIWWVQRTLHNFRVQARKPITVTSPTCAFDSTNGQYYPYAILDDDGVAID
ncbi:unnamed protein product [Ectocarpus sp. 12 AP-2014]